jgi:hypothetical protein
VPAPLRDPRPPGSLQVLSDGLRPSGLESEGALSRVGPSPYGSRMPTRRNRAPTERPPPAVAPVETPEVTSMRAGRFRRIPSGRAPGEEHCFSPECDTSRDGPAASRGGPRSTVVRVRLPR